jgi:putative addiction module component (TIGR02574 family)
MKNVSGLWDSISALSVPIPDELKAELNRRLAEFEANPEAGFSWEEARRRILQGEWRHVGAFEGGFR